LVVAIWVVMDRIVRPVIDAGRQIKLRRIDIR
jgi:hypothetical protein